MINQPLNSNTGAATLAKVYQLILTWPESCDTQNEPAADNLGGNAVAGSEAEMSYKTDITSSNNLEHMEKLPENQNGR